MPLRDYRAFEDLATKLGVHIDDVEVLNKDDAPRLRSPQIKPTKEVWDAAREYPEEMQS